MTLVMAVRSSPVSWSRSARTHLGRTRIYCRPACRKAAYEQRRAKKPGAVRVQVVERVVVETRRGHPSPTTPTESPTLSTRSNTSSTT